MIKRKSKLVRLTNHKQLLLVFMMLFISTTLLNAQSGTPPGLDFIDGNGNTITVIDLGKVRFENTQHPSLGIRSVFLSEEEEDVTYNFNTSSSNSSILNANNTGSYSLQYSAEDLYDVNVSVSIIPPNIDAPFEVYLNFLHNGNNINSIRIHGKADLSNPTTPTNLVASNITDQACSLSWTASTDYSGIKRYGVWVNDNFKGYTTNTSYNVTGMSPGTINNIKVIAFDNVDRSSDDASISVQTIVYDTEAPTVPTNPTISANVPYINVSWDPSTDNESSVAYKVIIKDYSSGQAIEFLNTTTANTFINNIPGVNYGRAYMLEVQAYDEAGNHSASSPGIGVFTKPTPPTSFQATNLASTSMRLWWDINYDVIAIEGFKIYNITTGNLIATTAANHNHLYINNLDPNINYNYEVVAYRTLSNGQIYYSDPASISVTTPSHTSSDTESPSVPENLSFNNYNVPDALVSWFPATDNIGVAGYKVNIMDWSTQTHIYSTTTTGTSTDYYCVLQPNHWYKLNVIAFDAALNDSQSSEIFMCTNPLSILDIGVLNVSPTQVTLSWTANPGGMPINGFRIFEDSRDQTRLIATIPSAGVSNTYKVNGLKSNQNYTFRVVPFTEFQGKQFVSASRSINVVTPRSISINKDGAGIDHGISIYPNPVSTSFNISGLGNDEEVIVAIYNNLGELVLTQVRNSNNSSIDLTKLSSGVYFARIEDLGGEILLNQKVIKE